MTQARSTVPALILVGYDAVRAEGARVSRKARDALGQISVKFPKNTAQSAISIFDKKRQDIDFEVNRIIKEAGPSEQAVAELLAEQVAQLRECINKFLTLTHQQ